MDQERRLDERIDVDNLPECLKIVRFKIGILEEYSADTVNASKYGMCFVVNGLNTMDISKGQELTLIISSHNYKLRSKVIYAVNAGNNHLKFGINFYNGHPIELYHRILEDGE